MDYERISVLEAVQELNCSELRLWLLLHTLTDRERVTSGAALSRRWGLNKRVVQDALRSLTDKCFLTCEASHKGLHKKVTIGLKRRLDTSAGPFLKFPG